MVPLLSTPPVAGKPKLLEQVRQLLRLRHYSLRTEVAYLAWVRRYILFRGKRHPRELTERDVSAFLSSLALDGKVAASTQNQALSALLFFDKEVLERELAFIGGVVRVKRHASPSDADGRIAQGVRVRVRARVRGRKMPNPSVL